VTAVAETQVAATLPADGEFDFYTYPPTGEQLDRVSTIISATDSKPWIKKWYGSSSTAWCVDNLELLAATIKSARKAAIDLGKDAATARADARKAAIDLGKDAAEQLRGIKRDAGSYVHDVLEALVLWAASPGRTGQNIALPVLPDHLAEAWYDDEPLVDVVDNMVTGFLNFASQFDPEILASEMTVYNQPLGVGGTLDLIIVIRGYAISYGTGPGGADEIVASPGSVLVICVDAKTGRNAEGTWKEQIAVYRRAPECRLPLGEMHPMIPTDCGAVLHLRPEYPDGFLLMLVSARDDESAWDRFRSAASVYRDRQKVKGKPGTVIRPLRADGTMPGPRLCDLAAEGYGRALSPLSRALGAGCELEDLARFTAAEVLAIRGVGKTLIEVIRKMLADHGLSLAGETAIAQGEAA
jgi:hypothetical protein